MYSGDFSASGGYIYAEYKTFSGVAYKSTNISVKKNETSTNPTTPTTPNPSDGYTQHIPYGGFPLLPQQFNTNVIDDIHIESQVWVDENDFQYGSQTNNQIYNSVKLRQRTTFNDGRRPVYSKQISAYPSNFYGTTTIVDNKIENNQYIINDEPPRTIIGNQATKTEGRRGQQVTTNLTNYQWQSRIKYPFKWSIFLYYFAQYGWTDIIGATEANYTPPKTEQQGMEYRRLVLEENFTQQTPYRRSAASNVINIIPLGSNGTKNIICCDQTIAVDKLANPIVGDYQELVQWQISNDGIEWEDIFGANSKDYLPTKSRTYSYGGTTSTLTDVKFYRRLYYDYYVQKKYCSSNIIKIIFELRDRSYNDESIKIYPNPATSILNIENTFTQRQYYLKDSNITIVNMMGEIVNSNNFEIINVNHVSINVSNLPIGVYFINILREGNRGPYTQQFTFTKN